MPVSCDILCDCHRDLHCQWEGLDIYKFRENLGSRHLTRQHPVSLSCHPSDARCPSHDALSSHDEIMGLKLEPTLQIAPFCPVIVMKPRSYCKYWASSMSLIMTLPPVTRWSRAESILDRILHNNLTIYYRQSMKALS